MSNPTTAGSQDEVWDEREARRIVKMAVGRYWYCVKDFKDLQPEEVINDIIVEAWKSRNTYNPDKAAYNTWLTNLTHCRLVDIYRSRQTRAVHHKRFMADATEEDTVARDEEEPDNEWVDASLPLAEQLSQMYRRLCASGARRVRQGQRFYNMAQVGVVVLLMRRRKLSVRGARDLFASSPTLLAAVRLDRLPSRKFFHACQKVSVSKRAEKSVTTSNEALGITEKAGVAA